MEPPKPTPTGGSVPPLLAAGGPMNRVVEFFTGIDFSKGLSKPKLLPLGFPANFAPAPIGYVDPAVFHLERRFVGLTLTDISYPITGRPATDLLTQQHQIGRDVMRVTEEQIAYTQGLTVEELRGRVRLLEDDQRNAVAGPGIRSTLALGVARLTLSERLLQPGRERPVVATFRPGGGVVLGYGQIQHTVSYATPDQLEVARVARLRFEIAAAQFGTFELLSIGRDRFGPIYGPPALLNDPAVRRRLGLQLSEPVNNLQAEDRANAPPDSPRRRLLTEWGDP